AMTYSEAENLMPGILPVNAADAGKLHHLQAVPGDGVDALTLGGALEVLAPLPMPTLVTTLPLSRARLAAKAASTSACVEAWFRAEMPSRRICSFSTGP
ncbi:MAG: hypothetical protein ACPG8Q_00955, partial [Candidatus Poseidoniaceae archaeon]